MAFGPKRGYSDTLERRHIENLRAAVTFAHEIGHPLNLCIDINWTRTELGDDPDGSILDKLMELSRKWLKRRGVAVFAHIEIRENPTRPSPCPNMHILLHCPWPLIASFEAWFLTAATRLCWRLDEGAVLFPRVGNGNPTVNAALGKLRYMSKGVALGCQAVRHHARAAGACLWQAGLDLAGHQPCRPPAAGGLTTY
jgi:hypothetical protein